MCYLTGFIKGIVHLLINVILWDRVYFWCRETTTKLFTDFPNFAYLVPLVFLSYFVLCMKICSVRGLSWTLLYQISAMFPYWLLIDEKKKPKNEDSHSSVSRKKHKEKQQLRISPTQHIHICSGILKCSFTLGCLLWNCCLEAEPVSL